MASQSMSKYVDVYGMEFVQLLLKPILIHKNLYQLVKIKLKSILMKEIELISL